MISVTGALVAALSCGLLVRAFDKLPVTGTGVSYSLKLTQLEICENGGSQLVQITPNKAKQNRNGQFTLSTNLNLMVPYDDKITIDLEMKPMNAANGVHTTKVTLKSCQDLMGMGKELVTSFMKAANFDFKGCPLPIGNYTVNDWVSSVKVHDVPFLMNDKFETTFHFSRDGEKVGCFKAFNTIDRV